LSIDDPINHSTHRLALNKRHPQPLATLSPASACTSTSFSQALLSPVRYLVLVEPRLPGTLRFRLSCCGFDSSARPCDDSGRALSSSLTLAGLFRPFTRYMEESSR
jgi:hypothetical protein